MPVFHTRENELQVALATLFYTCACKNDAELDFVAINTTNHAIDGKTYVANKQN